jgi:hypothetical protein
VNIIHKYFPLFGIIYILLTPTNSLSQRAQPDNFRGYLQEIIVKLPDANSGVYTQPKEDDLFFWIMN